MEIQVKGNVGYQGQGSYSKPGRAVEGITTDSPEQHSDLAEQPSSVVTQAANADSSDSRKEDEGSAERDNERVREAVKEINKHANGTEAVFGINEKTNRVTIKIVDKETKEVVREVPAEKTLDLIAKAWEMAGILVDEKR